MAIVIDTTKAPPVDAMRSAGVVGVVRYLSWLYRYGGTTHTTINPKIIQKPEYDALRAAGLDITLNWEYDPYDWTTGASGGAAHAAEAVRQAKALGYPAGCAIYGSADFNMTASQWTNSCRAYAAAFASGVRAGGYRPGVYGPYDVLSSVQAAGLMDLFWQAGMSTAWSDGRNANPWPHAHLRQRARVWIGGVDCDKNDILQANYGQAEAATPADEEDDMKTSPRSFVQVKGDKTVYAVALLDDGHGNQVESVIACHSWDAVQDWMTQLGVSLRVTDNPVDAAWLKAKAAENATATKPAAA